MIQLLLNDFADKNSRVEVTYRNPKIAKINSFCFPQDAFAREGEDGNKIWVTVSTDNRFPILKFKLYIDGSISVPV